MIGAARTSAYYAVSPFIAAAFSLAVFREVPDTAYFAVLALMAVGAWLAAGDGPIFGIKKKVNDNGAHPQQ